MVDLNSIITRSQELLTSEVDGEVVMMNIEGGKYYGINSVGAEIWRLMENPVSVSNICSELVKTFEIDNQTCESEVLTFLASLEAESLLNFHN
jgi:hypothetical protein